MNRSQVIYTLMGLSAVALILLFPHWVAPHDEGGTRGLGYAWIGTPPAPVHPDDVGELDVGLPLTAEDRRQMAAHMAASYGAPEIDWWAASVKCSAVLIYFAFLVFVSSKRTVPKQTCAEDVFS